MIKFRDIELEDKADFDKVLAQIQPEISDFTFTNFYMWRESYGLTVSFDPDLECWFLQAKPKKWKPFFFTPLCDWSDFSKIQAAFEKLQTYAETEEIQLFFRRVPETAKDLLLKVDPDLHIREDRNTFDYVYQVEDLTNLSGRKYHAKRNHLNQFLRKYQWDYQVITPEILKEILDLEETWFNIRLDQKPNITAENIAMAKVMNQYFQLGVTGGVIRVDRKIQAISVGEKLNRNCAVIHIEKANTDFSGIYPAINQQFLLNHWQEMQLINREEDMGLEGLRKAKLSYYPSLLATKYNLYK